MVLSSQQKFEATNVKSLKTDHVSALGQISVTAQFYLENKGKYILEARGHANPKDLKRRERARVRARAQERETPQAFGSFNPM